MKSFNKIIFLLFSPLLMAQVGVGTPNPRAIFHIDGQSDTPETGNTETLTEDDLIVQTTTGNLGIGNLNPKVKVDIRNTSANSALGLGTTTLSAQEAGEGAMRYNGSNLQYSNGTQWVNLTPTIVNKTIIIATKTNQDVFVYGAGGYTNAGGCQNCTIQGAPHRTPAFITNWVNKYTNTTEGGSFDASTGTFTANRAATFTATFTFALAPGKIRAWNGSANAVDANQVEAIWRIYDTNGTTEINSIKCANTFPSDSRQANTDSGNAMAASNCTGSIYLLPGQKIRPALWIDLAPDGTTTKPFDLTAVGGSSIYNNLTIVEN